MKRKIERVKREKARDEEGKREIVEVKTDK